MAARLAVLVLVVAAGCSPRGGDATRDERGRAPNFAPVPDSWTHKELAEHLAAKGVKVEVKSLQPRAQPEEPAAEFVDRETGGRVDVFLCKDARAAADRAGSLGKDAFAAGRFAIGHHLSGEQDVALLNRVRAALE